MTDRIQCEFFLLRYVPDAVKNEFVNIGVMLREAGRTETTQVRFTRDWSRVRCVDPDVDTAMLEALEGEIGRRLAEDAQAGVASLEDALSNAVQMTEAKACLAESFATEMDTLMQLYVQTAKRRRESRRTGRVAVQHAMRTEFERAGVWDLMQTGNPELYSYALGLNPTGRMGTPEEMARAVVFLSSPLSSFTTGTNLVVDGALTRGVQF